MKLLLCLTWIVFMSSCVRHKPVIVDAPAGQDSVTVSFVVASGTDLSKIDLSTAPITTTPLPSSFYQLQIDAIKKGQDSIRTQLAKAVVPPTTTQLQTLITTIQAKDASQDKLIGAQAADMTAVKASVKKDTLVVSGQTGYLKIKKLSEGKFGIEIDSSFIQAVMKIKQAP